MHLHPQKPLNTRASCHHYYVYKSPKLKYPSSEVHCSTHKAFTSFCPGAYGSDYQFLSLVVEKALRTCMECR